MIARVRRTPAPAAVSGVHLSEARGGWTLSLSLTPELLALVVEAARTGEPVTSSPDAVCRMHVQPNLLPGEPFDIRDITVVALPPTSHLPHPTKENHA